MMKKNFSNENRKKLGHSLEDILFKCKFNNKPCGVKDFTWMFSNYYGNCYVFNAWNGSETTKTSFIAGSQFGLNLELYANFNQQLNIFNQPFGPAIYIRIENGSSLKGDTLNGIIVPSGFLTYVSLDRVFNKNLKRPYSNCDITEHDNSFDSTFFRLISHSPYAYTQELCLLQCLQTYTKNTCNCTNPWTISLFDDVEYCETKEGAKCEMKIFNDEKYVSTFFKEVKTLNLFIQKLIK
jgi:uncharacterized repeat protein (TIGR02543 family)